MNWFDKKRAVVPIDFGEDSNRAVDVALDILCHPENVRVIHVAPDMSLVGPGIAMGAMDQQARQQQLEKTFHDRFKDTKYHNVQYTTAFGDPGHKIADYAQDIQADLIVMPSQGRTGLTRILIGSVAERVVRLAHCPVLVLRN
ncbi:MAG: universal stress protein [Pirellulales bacterium]|nr:universal stress protein [Pirellulales bacterium]